MCWQCYLKQADLRYVMPCKNLCAAHVACPNPRTADNGKLFCDDCREQHGRRCRNLASKCAPCASPQQAQDKDKGFCRACAGQPAGLLCLNSVSCVVAQQTPPTAGRLCFAPPALSASHIQPAGLIACARTRQPHFTLHQAPCSRFLWSLTRSVFGVRQRNQRRGSERPHHLLGARVSCRLCFAS